MAVQRVVKSNLTSAMDAMKTQADKHRRNVEFEVNARIWLRTDHL